MSAATTDTITPARARMARVPAGQEPREAPATWWQTEQPPELVLERALALPFAAVSDANQRTRRRGLVKLLDAAGPAQPHWAGPLARQRR